MQSEIASFLPDADVPRINSDRDLSRAVEQGADLLLINREPVGFDESGLDLVREVCGKHPDLKVMLVSDYDQAQKEAVSAGALPGFGKQLMGTPKLAEAVERALGT